jgi:hypothetical protein
MQTPIPESEDLPMVLPGQDWSPWVYMDLEWGKFSDGKLVVLLTINFGKHHLEILRGRVWFGLRGVELELEPSNATIPYGYRWPMSPLQEEIKIKCSVKDVDITKDNRSEVGDYRSGFGPKGLRFSIGSSGKREKGAEQTAEAHDEFEHMVGQVDTRGSAEKAYWDFEVRRGDTYLQGRLDKKEICKLILQDERCILRSTLRTVKKDIRFLSGEGLWPEHLTKKKKSVIMGLLRRHIANTMKPEIRLLRLEWPDSGSLHGPGNIHREDYQR